MEQAPLDFNFPINVSYNFRISLDLFGSHPWEVPWRFSRMGDNKLLDRPSISPLTN